MIQVERDVMRTHPDMAFFTGDSPEAEAHREVRGGRWENGAGGRKGMSRHCGGSLAGGGHVRAWCRDPWIGVSGMGAIPRRPTTRMRPMGRQVRGPRRGALKQISFAPDRRGGD